MKSVTLHQTSEHLRTLAFVFEPDEDPVALLADVATELGLASCEISAVGAFSRATLGYFDHARRAYEHIPIAERVEVLSLHGDVAIRDGKRVVQLRCVLGLRDGTTRGGHLLHANVWPALEVIVAEQPPFLQKRFDPTIGFAMLFSDDV